MKLSNVNIYPRFHHLLNNKVTEEKKVEEKVFFFHIPKCGGTSIDRAIQSTIKVSERREREIFHLDAAAALRTSNVWAEAPLDLTRKFLYYCMASQRYRYISGHFAYSEKAMQDFGHDWKFVTLLRDPVSKWFSQYFYNRYKQNDHYKISCDLETFLKSDEAVHLGRNYIFLLVEGITKAEASSEAAIAQSIANLEKFSLVGVLEKMDLFSRSFENQFGVQLEIEQRNKNPLSKQHQLQQITDDMRQRVVELCQPNQQVYEAALKMAIAVRQSA
ncbi:MAG: sulfotransferase family 2 domain-containing protein [Cyanothece sp. SIO1E1]|nr:sulfotransferase family 2 domain-containing protein [Cyanothece sp. SIO1E1]